MNYTKFVQVPELFRFSFQNLCENQNTKEEESSPIVCIIALKDKDYSATLEVFRSKIRSMEEEIYTQQIEKQENLNSHIKKI